MSRKIRLVAALLVLSLFALGSLNALPLNHPSELAKGGTSTLLAVVDWIASLFSWDRPHGKVPPHLQDKGLAQVDPDGHH
jgi:hypothetical protein